MGRYREEDVLQGQGLVSEQVASGKSIAVFCGERGLRDRQFYEWKANPCAKWPAPSAAILSVCGIVRATAL